MVAFCSWSTDADFDGAIEQNAVSQIDLQVTAQEQRTANRMYILRAVRAQGQILEEYQLLSPAMTSP